MEQKKITERVDFDVVELLYFLSLVLSFIHYQPLNKGTAQSTLLLGNFCIAGKNCNIYLLGWSL